MKPPKIADRFLKWFCRKDLLEFVYGDLHELYTERLHLRGRRYADLAFYWDVIRVFRLSNIRKVKNSNTIMFKNYLKVGFRSLKKNWINSLINISGLSLSVGCAVTTFLFADFFFNLNSIHSNRENIYQVISHIDENSKDVLYGPSPMIIGDRLKEDFPEVEGKVRMQFLRGNVKFGSNVFRELILFTDPSYLEVFDFPYEGRALVPGSILISTEMAKKYFGDIEPIGQRMDVKFGEEKLLLEVVGILGEVPSNTTFHRQLVIHLDHYFQLETAKNNWIDEAKATFVSLDPETNVQAFNYELESYQKIQNEANPSSPVRAFELIPFTQLSGQSDLIRDAIVHGNEKGGTIGIATTGILLILFACLNYVNIAITSAKTRLKEIGVRKVMGGSRSGIAQQFLTENFLTCFFAMVIGVILCYFLLLPGFNQFSPVAIPFSFSSISTAVVYFVSLFLILGLLSGSYPAFYISRFQTLKIFRGENDLGGRNYLSRILLTFQFFLAIVTILGCFIFADNSWFVKKVSWGYDPAGILALPIGEKATLEAMRTEAARNSNVQITASSYGHLGVNNNLVPFEYQEKKFRVLTYDVEPGYLPAMNMVLLGGRFFEKSGDDQSIVVNNLFVEQMGWSDPLGQSVEFDGERRTVVGVISDVYHVFFSDDIKRPMIITSGQKDPNHLIVKASEHAVVGVNDYLKEQWGTVAPFDPYVSVFQSDIFDRQYDNVDANVSFMMTLSVMTIFLSCLGLYGLLAFVLQNRQKEFGIRKVLGASPIAIIKLANREFIWILVIAFGLGAPVGALSMFAFVEKFFTISKPFSPIPVLVCAVVMSFTILITVYAQIRKVVRVNPAVTLKAE